MRTEPPTQRLHRRLGGRSDTDTAAAEPDPADEPDDDWQEQDPNSLLPRWSPAGSAQDGWLARIRADPGRAGAIALGLIAAVAVLVTVFTVMREKSAPVMSAKLPAVAAVSSASHTPSADPDRPVVVSVVGLVRNPGLVTLAPGSRIADALAAAGDPLDGADTLGLNIARQVVDGEQIVVGIAAPPGQPAVLGSSVTSGSPDGPAGPASQATTGPKPGELIDLNTATVQQLDTLPGVGPVTAAAIVAWRDTHGKFTSVEQLAEVDGIGPARLEKLRTLVRV